MTKDFSRIGINHDRVNNTSNFQAGTLSKEGEVFCEFMNDRIPAKGNNPRVEIRSRLIALFREDLRTDKDPNDKYMEDDHGYIQWFFPLEQRGVNPQAPIVTSGDHVALGADEDFRVRIFEHFMLFAEFMGIEYIPENGEFHKVDAKQWNSWINNGHNNLRISRILTSLCDFGLQQVATDLLLFLQRETQRESPEIISDEEFIPFREFTKESCQKFWSKAL